MSELKTKKRFLLAIVGPTAVGKTEIAIEVAQKLNSVEIISADSLQVYRYMNIGTAKPTLEQRQSVRHHLIDIIDPDEEFSVADYQRMALKTIENIHSSGKVPILVGGTGLYVKAVTDEEIREVLLKSLSQGEISSIFKDNNRLDYVKELVRREKALDLVVERSALEVSSV